jgi:hypothetical protein
VLASQALHRRQREAPPALRGLVEDVRAIVAPVEDPRPIGSECQQLYEQLTAAALGERPSLG